MIQVEFVAPPALVRQVEADQVEAGESMQLLTFPIDCRRILDGEKPLDTDGLADFWRMLQAIAEQSVSEKDDAARQCDAIAGGIAVLLKLYRNWLKTDPEREKWCFKELERLTNEPTPRRDFDFPDSAGDWNCDCFLAEAGVCLLQESADSQFVRSIVALGVAAYHYGTTGRTMRLASQLQGSLGGDFQRMQHLAIRWSAIRRLRDQSGAYLAQVREWHNSDAPESSDAPTAAQFTAECERWRDAHRGLIDQFVHRTTSLITLRDVSAIGSLEVERLMSIRFPARRTRTTRPAKGSSYHRRRKMRRTDSGVDAKVLQAAFSWIDLSSAVSQDERAGVIGNVRDLLGLVLDSLQAALDEDGDEHDDEFDGLPDEFDGWVFGRVARAIVQMRDDEQPSSLWQPILSLEFHAHEWVERFFWYWFSDGVQASPSVERFSQRWVEMVQFAFTSPCWDPAVVQSHYLDDMVFELLGYHFGLHSIAVDEQFAPQLERMTPVFEIATKRWFAMSRVANGFAQSLAGTAYDRLLCPGIRWLHRAMNDAGEYEFWRQHDIESHLIAALNRCWERYHETVAVDPETQGTFLGLLTALASRGNHAAMALRERLVDSIPQRE